MDVVRRLIIWLACALDWHEFDEVTAEYPGHAGGDLKMEAKPESGLSQEFANAWNRRTRFDVYECRHCGKLIRILRQDWPLLDQLPWVEEFAHMPVNLTSDSFRLPGQAIHMMRWQPYWRSWHGPRTLRIRSVQAKSVEEQPHAD